MTFWGTISKLASQAADLAAKEIKEAGSRKEEYKAEMEDMSDKELISIIRRNLSSSPIKATVARQELINRGYSSEEIKLLLKNS